MCGGLAAPHILAAAAAAAKTPSQTMLLSGAGWQKNKYQFRAPAGLGKKKRGKKKAPYTVGRKGVVLRVSFPTNTVTVLTTCTSAPHVNTCDVN